MLDDKTTHIEINSEPFSGVTSSDAPTSDPTVDSSESTVYKVVDHTTQSIGIGTISIVTASEASEGGSLITLKFLEGNDTVNVEEVNGCAEEDVSLDDIVTLQ